MVALTIFLFLHQYLHFPLTYFSIVSSTTDLSFVTFSLGEACIPYWTQHRDQTARNAWC